MQEENQQIERISFKFILTSIMSVLNLEKGVLYTIWALTRRPGETLKTYLFTDRTKLTAPFRLLFFTTAIAAFFSLQLFHINGSGFKKGYEIGAQSAKPTTEINAEKQEEINKKVEEASTKMDTFFRKHFNTMILLAVPIFAWLTFLFFKKMGYYYAEHLVINSYISSYQNIIYILMFPIMKGYPIEGSMVYMGISYIFSIYIFMNVFDSKSFGGLMRSLTIIVIGLILYMILFAIIGVTYILLSS